MYPPVYSLQPEESGPHSTVPALQGQRLNLFLWLLSHKYVKSYKTPTVIARRPEGPTRQSLIFEIASLTSFARNDGRG